MTIQTDLLGELESIGTAQNRKIYKRHGVGEDQFGVSYGNLRAMQKKIKKDHAAALALWESGNHDARILATMIADPKQADDALLESWARDLDNYVISDALSDYASKTPLAREKMEQWTKSDDEWVGTVGWNIMAHLAMKDKNLPDSFFEPYIGVIQRDIHNRKNRTRYAMNGALIAIGMRSDALRTKTLDAASKIGVVMVDHGETGCKTPDAVEYINKAAARKK